MTRRTDKGPSYLPHRHRGMDNSVHTLMNFSFKRHTHTGALTQAGTQKDGRSPDGVIGEAFPRHTHTSVPSWQGNEERR